MIHKTIKFLHLNIFIWSLKTKALLLLPTSPALFKITCLHTIPFHTNPLLLSSGVPLPPPNWPHKVNLSNSSTKFPIRTVLPNYTQMIHKTIKFLPLNMFIWSLKTKALSLLPTSPALFKIACLHTIPFHTNPLLKSRDLPSPPPPNWPHINLWNCSTKFAFKNVLPNYTQMINGQWKLKLSYYFQRHMHSLK